MTKPSPVDRRIGTAIRKARRAADLSQTELGDRIGKTYQQVQKYEAGTNRVSLSTFLKVAEVLGIQAATPVGRWIEEGNR